ncbi:MAG: S41 family peptidase [Acetobacteraceae bacterium]
MNEILISDIKGSARQYRVRGREVAQARRHAVNGGTRSGKEVLAYGFKKYHLGELIGMPTARSVLAATAFLMGNGDLLLVAVEDVLVEGQRLEGIGVTPTIEVPFDLLYAAGRDPQLERAEQVLSRMTR